ncbi:MAG TPA: hypothetical protein VN924_16400 [Bryobacteraceae bacterium]|nr:hypothetical protein [Bryobacteraceae bacterium]
MRLFALTALLTALGCLAQEPAPPDAGSPSIAVPAGTKVPLRLTSPLGTKTARRGDAVHAEIAFPVTVANTVAIPPGTYVAGVIDQVTRRGRHAGFTMHFTNMVFSNGYTVTLSGAHADIRAGVLRTGEPLSAASTSLDAPAGGMALQSTPPTVSQPQRPGPDIGVVVGLTAGSAAVGIAVIAILAHRGTDLYLHAGWRFEMALANPLSLDAAKVAAAVANPAPR